MDSSTILLSLISACIGTFGGAYAFYRFENRKFKKVRDIAIKALDIFQKYGEKNKTYEEASSDFNTSLSISEKRAVVVALSKLGVPFDFSKIERFSVKDIPLLSEEIHLEDIKSMRDQIKSGNCDSLFFMDVEQTFGKEFRIRKFRENAVKYVDKVLRLSTIDFNKNIVTFPENWYKDFSFSDRLNLLVIKEVIVDPEFFDSKTSNPNKEKLDNLVQDILSGYLDQYLLSEYYTFKNIKEQQDFAREARYSLQMQNSRIQESVNLNASSDNKPVT